MTRVMINLLDSNDNNPQFVPTNTYQFIVDGNGSLGEMIGQVMASMRRCLLHSVSQGI